MSTYLVTGGEGFIGGRIASKTNAKTYDLKSGKNILNKEVLSGELSDDIKGIFHCAALISVPESFEKTREYYENNVMGTKCVAEVAEKVGTKIVFSSSSAVYGELNAIASEESHTNPKSPYAENKMEGEEILKKFSNTNTNTNKRSHIALRYFNVYGPGQSDAYAGVITIFIKKALKNEDINIYGDGEQVRDFIFVDDVAEANILAMKYDNKSFEVFNIGSGTPIKIKELAELIIKLTNSSSKIVYLPEREGDIGFSQADISKAKLTLGWSPEVSLEDGLRTTIEYIKKNI